MNGESKTILLIEDNPVDERLTVRALNQGRLLNTIHVARDGEEAVDYLFGAEANGEPPGPLPQLILLDLKIPKVSGIDVLRQIRANPRTHMLPVVVLTSSDESVDIRSCYDLGANSYVRKPVAFEAFEKAVSEIGLYWLVVNNPPVHE